MSSPFYDLLDLLDLYYFPTPAKIGRKSAYARMVGVTDDASDKRLWSRLMERTLIPTFLWNFCERSSYITLNRMT